MVEYDSLLVGLCRDLLRMHQATGIDLGEWENARNFVGRYIDWAIADAKCELAEAVSALEKSKEVA